LFNLKCGIQKIFNRQQLNEKTESIVTPRIQEVNDGAGSSREILNENLYVSAEDENFETNNSISEENTPSILNSDKSELYSDFDPENTICSSDSDTVNLPKNVKSNKVVHFSVLYILLFSDTLFKLAFTAQRDNLLQKNLFDSKLSEFLISCIFVIKMHCFCQKNLKINMFFMFDYVKINRSDFC
jgi:hypothetical protein